MREFNNYLKENGISYKVITPYSLEQNKKAERVNDCIIGPVKAILTQ